MHDASLKVCSAKKTFYHLSFRFFSRHEKIHQNKKELVGNYAINKNDTATRGCLQVCHQVAHDFNMADQLSTACAYYWHNTWVHETDECRIEMIRWKVWIVGRCRNYAENISISRRQQPTSEDLHRYGKTERIEEVRVGKSMMSTYISAQYRCNKISTDILWPVLSDESLWNKRKHCGEKQFTEFLCLFKEKNFVRKM